MTREPARTGEDAPSDTDREFRREVDRILLLKEGGASQQEIRAAYAGMDGDLKTMVGSLVRQEYQRRQGWRVYFAKFPRLGLIKVGISRNVPKRLAYLGRLKRDAPELLLEFPGIFSLEGWYHAELHDWRVEGEWFALNDTTLALVDKIKRDGPAIVLEAA